MEYSRMAVCIKVIEGISEGLENDMISMSSRKRTRPVCFTERHNIVKYRPHDHVLDEYRNVPAQRFSSSRSTLSRQKSSGSLRFTQTSNFSSRTKCCGGGGGGGGGGKLSPAKGDSRLGTPSYETRKLPELIPMIKLSDSAMIDNGSGGNGVISGARKRGDIFNYRLDIPTTIGEESRSRSPSLQYQIEEDSRVKEGVAAAGTSLHKTILVVRDEVGEANLDID